MGLGSIFEALRMLQSLPESMCHFQARTADDPVRKLGRKLYLQCLRCTWIAFLVNCPDEPGQNNALRKSRNTAPDI